VPKNYLAQIILRKNYWDGAFIGGNKYAGICDFLQKITNGPVCGWSRLHWQGQTALSPAMEDILDR